MTCQNEPVVDSGYVQLIALRSSCISRTYQPLYFQEITVNTRCYINLFIVVKRQDNGARFSYVMYRDAALNAWCDMDHACLTQTVWPLQIIASYSFSTLGSPPTGSTKLPLAYFLDFGSQAHLGLTKGLTLNRTLRYQSANLALLFFSSHTDEVPVRPSHRKDQLHICLEQFAQPFQRGVQP